MGEWLAAIDVASASSTGLLGVGVLAIMRGWLVPARTLDAIRADLEGQVAECRAREAEWREAFRVQQDRADVAVSQLAQYTDALVKRRWPKP